MKKLALSLLSFAIVSTVNAEDALEETNVTAYKIPVAASDVGTTSITLDGEMLEQQGIEFVADALRKVPSIAVSSSGGHGSYTQIRIRGQEANHTLVLIDGIRLSDPVTGGVDLANLKTAGIAKIEILLGAQSMMHGADAIGGVINIITHYPEDGVNGLLSTGVGSHNTKTNNLSISAGTEHVFASAAISSYSTDGISAGSEHNGNTEEDPYDSKSAHLTAGIKFGGFKLWTVYHRDDNELHFDTDGTDANGYYTGLVSDEPLGIDNMQVRDSEYALVGISHNFADRLTLQATVASSKDTNETQSYSAWSPTNISFYETQGERDRAEALINYVESQVDEALRPYGQKVLASHLVFSAGRASVTDTRPSRRLHFSNASRVRIARLPTHVRQVLQLNAPTMYQK